MTMNDKIFRTLLRELHLKERRDQPLAEVMAREGEIRNLYRAYADWLDEQGRAEEAWKRRDRAGDVEVEYILVHKPTGMVLKNYGKVPGNLAAEVRRHKIVLSEEGMCSWATAHAGLTESPRFPKQPWNTKPLAAPLSDFELRLRIVRREVVMSLPGRMEAELKKGTQ